MFHGAVHNILGLIVSRETLSCVHNPNIGNVSRETLSFYHENVLFNFLKNNIQNSQT